MAPLSSSSLSSFSGNSDLSFFNTAMEVKPRLDLWSENSSVWSLSSPSPDLNKPAKKSVRFSSRRNKTQTIIHISEFTPEEKKSCWYSRSEFTAMRKARDDCTKCLDRNQPLPEDEAIEGLETSNESFFSIHRIRRAIHAVLAEQHDQRMFGMVDPEYLALRYTAHSTPSTSCKQSLQTPSQHTFESAPCYLLAAVA